MGDMNLYDKVWFIIFLLCINKTILTKKHSELVGRENRNVCGSVEKVYVKEILRLMKIINYKLHPLFVSFLIQSLVEVCYGIINTVLCLILYLILH